MRLAKAGDVKRLAVFHHDPNHDDEFMRSVELQAAEKFENSSVAKEGMKVDI